MWVSRGEQGGAAVTRSDLYKVSMTAGFSLQDLIELDPATRCDLKIPAAAAERAASGFWGG